MNKPFFRRAALLLAVFAFTLALLPLPARAISCDANGVCPDGLACYNAQTPDPDCACTTGFGFSGFTDSTFTCVPGGFLVNDCCIPFADETSNAACADGIDNDEDSLIDCNDPDCVAQSVCVGLTMLNNCTNVSASGASGFAVQYTYDAHPQDDRNLAVTVKATCSVGPWQLLDSFHTRVRIQNGACPTCSKQKGRYFAGTVQVRADGRPLTEAESRRAKELVDRSGSGDEFVSGVEDVRGGFDVKVSSNPFAKRLARDLSRTLGGTVGSSATLHTQREGKDVYRSTYVVRLPGFREGDQVEWRGARYRVVGLGDSVQLEDAATGTRVRVRPRELRTARLVP